MTTLTATIVLAKNNYTTTDISAANTEYIIDDAIDFVNFDCGQTMSNMSGVAGSKTVTVTYAQNAVLSTLLTCMLRDAKKTGLSNSDSTSASSGTSKSVGVGNINVSESSSVSSAISAASSLNSADDFTRSMYVTARQRLIGMSFRRA